MATSSSVPRTPCVRTRALLPRWEAGRDCSHKWLDGVSHALACALRLLRDLRPLRRYGPTHAPTPAGDYPPRASHFPGGQREHSSETVEDRRADPRQRTARVHRLLRKLPLGSAVSRRLAESTRPAAIPQRSLSRTSADHPHGKGLAQRSLRAPVSAEVPMWPFRAKPSEFAARLPTLSASHSPLRIPLPVHGQPKDAKDAVVLRGHQMTTPVSEAG